MEQLSLVYGATLLLSGSLVLVRIPLQLSLDDDNPFILVLRLLGLPLVARHDDDDNVGSGHLSLH